MFLVVCHRPYSIAGIIIYKFGVSAIESVLGDKSVFIVDDTEISITINLLDSVYVTAIRYEINNLYMVCAVDIVDVVISFNVCRAII